MGIFFAPGKETSTVKSSGNGKNHYQKRWQELVEKIRSKG